MKDFTDKTALVSGAASGIGKALAERAAIEDMFKVVVMMNRIAQIALIVVILVTPLFAKMMGDTPLKLRSSGEVLINSLNDDIASLVSDLMVVIPFEAADRNCFA